MNALAVEIAAREGARIVWMPTVDSPAETAGRTEPKPGDNVPQWARLQHELRELGLSIEPVHVTDAEGALLPETRDVLRAIARHDLILASGHLGRDDTFAVVDGAFEEGVRDVVITHPEFPCQDFSLEDQAGLAARGCLLERCLTTPQSGRRRGSTSWTASEQWASSGRSSRAIAGTRSTPPSRTVWRSGPTGCSPRSSTRTRCGR